MNYHPKSLRTFIGAKNFDISRRFYKDLGFEETVIDPKMSYFKVSENTGFYLQDYYVADWVNNSMLFLEVDDLDVCIEELLGKGLESRYDNVRFTGIKTFEWGREFFMHDPAGVLWHIGEFND